MKEHLPQLRLCSLFAPIRDDELLAMLACLKSQLVYIQKGGSILRQGDAARFFGVLLSGRAHIIRSDSHGAHNVINVIEPGALFAEAFACASTETLPVDIYAVEPSCALLLDQQRVMNGCRSGCMAHSMLVSGLLHSIADKNLQLTKKLEIVTQRTTREKVLAYLHSQKQAEGLGPFRIPFDRQGLADFLEVDRSGLSAEIGRLKKQGVLDSHKNSFRLLNVPEHEN